LGTYGPHEMASIETASIGHIGIQLSRLCVGGMQAVGWHGCNDDRFVKGVRHAVQMGVNFLDTAPAYGDGHSETLMGKAIEGQRDRVVIATKFSFLSSRPADVRVSLEQSLRRLGTDYIDVFQQHWPTPDVPLADTIGELERLKAQGKIRAIGVSNWMEPEWEELGDPCRVDSLQPCHSLLWRSIEPRVLPMCRRHSIAVIPYSPLCQGLLTGRFKSLSDIQPPPGDPRNGNRRMRADSFGAALKVLNLLEDVGKKYGKTPAQTALRWLLDQPGITSVIVGASSVEQVNENLGALGWMLEPSDWQRLSIASWPLSEGLGPWDTLWGWHPKVRQPGFITGR
jgi:myo-inositol catabolism protein IolS